MADPLYECVVIRRDLAHPKLLIPPEPPPLGTHLVLSEETLQRAGCWFWVCFDSHKFIIAVRSWLCMFQHSERINIPVLRVDGVERYDSPYAFSKAEYPAEDEGYAPLH